MEKNANRGWKLLLFTIAMEKKEKLEKKQFN